MLVATDDDIRNANIAFRARDISPSLPIVTTCSNDASEDILNLAGSTHVIKSAQQMGSFLSRRICFTDNFTHLIGNFEEVQIAEVNIHGTPLVGQRLKHANLREEYGVNVVGMWERGTFELPAPDAMLNNHTVLLLAGTETNFKNTTKPSKSSLSTPPRHHHRSGKGWPGNGKGSRGNGNPLPFY